MQISTTSRREEYEVEFKKKKIRKKKKEKKPLARVCGINVVKVWD